jgi:hypothetical protein
MSNPYLPPESKVNVTQSLPERPFTIKVAAITYISTLLLSVICIFVSGANKNFTLISALLMTAVLGVYLAGVYLIWAGWNWARILGVLFLILDTISRISLVIDFRNSYPVLAALLFVIVILDLLTIIFLLNKRTSGWLRNMKLYRANGF